MSVHLEYRYAKWVSRVLNKQQHHLRFFGNEVWQTRHVLQLHENIFKQTINFLQILIKEIRFDFQNLFSNTYKYTKLAFPDTLQYAKHSSYSKMSQNRNLIRYCIESQINSLMASSVIETMRENNTFCVLLKAICVKAVRRLCDI